MIPIPRNTVLLLFICAGFSGCGEVRDLPLQSQIPIYQSACLTLSRDILPPPQGITDIRLIQTAGAWEKLWTYRILDRDSGKTIDMVEVPEEKVDFSRQSVLVVYDFDLKMEFLPKKIAVDANSLIFYYRVRPVEFYTEGGNWYELHYFVLDKIDLSAKAVKEE